MTVEQARKAAALALGEFASGANPAAARRAFKAEPTLSVFHRVRHPARQKTGMGWTCSGSAPAKADGRQKLSEIDRAMIAKVLHDAEKAGKSVATVRNIRALASGVFGKAVEVGFLNYNPAQGVKVAGKKVPATASCKPMNCRVLRCGGRRTRHARLHPPGAADGREAGQPVRDALART